MSLKSLLMTTTKATSTPGNGAPLIDVDRFSTLTTSCQNTIIVVFSELFGVYLRPLPMSVTLASSLKKKIRFDLEFVSLPFQT